MDIALAVEYILPAAQYSGSVTANTEDAWNAVVWTDSRRAKPTWNELLAVAPDPAEQARAAQQKAFTDAIQARLDAFAQTRNYDNIFTVATYATSTNAKFQAEGQYAVEARDATWAKGYEIMAAVLAGERHMPTLEEVMAELPVLTWPDEVQSEQGESGTDSV